MYIGEANNVRLRTNQHRDHASKNNGLGENKQIHSCTKKLNDIYFTVMPFYKTFTDDVAMR